MVLLEKVTFVYHREDRPGMWPTLCSTAEDKAWLYVSPVNLNGKVQPSGSAKWKTVCDGTVL